MKEREITLPSGLSGIINPWKTKHLSSAFTDRRLLKRPGPAIENFLMRSAWKETLDHGPYSFDGSPPWLGEILQGDLFEALRQVRMLTWGDELEADFRCIDPSCRERISLTVHLDELEVKPLSEEGHQALMNDNSIAFTLPECGRQLTYALPTGRTQVLADKLAKQHGRRLESIWASRLHSVEGVESPAKYVEFLGNLDPTDSDALQDELERLDCGVETEIPDIVCEACDLEQAQEVQFGPAFFMPRTGRKRRQLM